jgi:hypothetical protein
MPSFQFLRLKGSRDVKRLAFGQSDNGQIVVAIGVETNDGQIASYLGIELKHGQQNAQAKK